MGYADSKQSDVKPQGVLPDKFPVNTLLIRLSRLNEAVKDLPNQDQKTKAAADITALTEFVKTLERLKPTEKG